MNLALCSKSFILTKNKFNGTLDSLWILHALVTVWMYLCTGEYTKCNYFPVFWFVGCAFCGMECKYSTLIIIQFTLYIDCIYLLVIYMISFEHFNFSNCTLIFCNCSKYTFIRSDIFIVRCIYSVNMTFSHRSPKLLIRIWCLFTCLRMNAIYYKTLYGNLLYPWIFCSNKIHKTIWLYLLAQCLFLLLHVHSWVISSVIEWVIRNGRWGKGKRSKVGSHLDSRKKHTTHVQPLNQVMRLCFLISGSCHCQRLIEMTLR